MTPPHWKQAQNRTIKLHEFQVIDNKFLDTHKHPIGIFVREEN